MSEFDDILEAIFHVGIMTVSYGVGQEAKKSLVRASEENNWLGLLISAIFCGGSAYAFQNSARSLNRLVGKQRGLPVYDLRKLKLLPE